VAAHAHGKPGILAAIDAGVKTIEHGSALDAETAALMAAKGMILVPDPTRISPQCNPNVTPMYVACKVPTRFAIQRLLDKGKGKLSAAIYAKLERVAVGHKAAVQAAIAAKVRIALGTDIQTSGRDSVLPFGMHGAEAQLMHDLGMDPLAVIEAATANGPLTVGENKAPLSGQLREGYDADLIVLDTNPISNLSALGDAERVRQVWKAGRLVKDTFFVDPLTDPRRRP